MKSGQHTSSQTNWGSPPVFYELARKTMGGIDLDPASSASWNARIGAWRYFDQRQDGLITPWVIGAPAPAEVCKPNALPAEPGRVFRVFCNPPGEKSGELVAGFWRALAGYVHLGWVSSAIWVGFSVEQLARLQRVGAPSHPLLWWTCVPKERQEYESTPGEAGGQPGHASFITLLSESAEEVDRFCDLASPLGEVINHTVRP